MRSERIALFSVGQAKAGIMNSVPKPYCKKNIDVIVTEIMNYLEVKSTVNAFPDNKVPR